MVPHRQYVALHIKERRCKTDGLFGTSVECLGGKKACQKVNKKGKQVLESLLFSSVFPRNNSLKNLGFTRSPGDKIHGIAHPTLPAVRALAAADFVLAPVIKKKARHRDEDENNLTGAFLLAGKDVLVSWKA